MRDKQREIWKIKAMKWSEVKDEENIHKLDIDIQYLAQSR